MDSSTGRGVTPPHLTGLPYEGEPSEPLRAYDLLCFSHLRWDSVHQRPHHLMGRSAVLQRVYFIEEPVTGVREARLELHNPSDGLHVVTPHLPAELDATATATAVAGLLDQLLKGEGIERFVSWYYTPMALEFSRHLTPAVIVYDCMDELANFRGAPAAIGELEAELLKRANIVFTGGPSLHEEKRGRHGNVHLFPSSIDAAHFRRARKPLDDPADQRDLGRPRLGYFGAIDERIDTRLLAEVADARPEWQIVMLGPVVKLAPEELPERENIHYLGLKAYADLPGYLANWDVALLPFASNDATRFVSPTKIPEYLAGAKRVVSTPVHDVVRPFGDAGLVAIADGTDAFVAAVEDALEGARRGPWLEAVDAFLSHTSWDTTWNEMTSLVTRLLPTAQVATPGSKNTAFSRRASDASQFDYLVVGAGFAGSVLAERLASDAGKRVLVVEARHHIGGNAYDHHDEAGVLVHRYGPHIFHTNSRDVFDYLSNFTEWRPYEHRVLASVDGQLVPIPINLDTVNRLFGLELTALNLDAFFAARAESIETVRTSEDVVVSKIGRELYEKFFRGYTRKQWGLDPSELDASVTARVPTRTNRDDRYFTDTYQAMPRDGYTRMFERMLSHPNISVMLGTDYHTVKGLVPHREVIYTGPIDAYFDHCFGPLPYRSLDFKFETLNQEFAQSVGTINYPNEHAYTRITEFKHLTGQEHPKTSLVYEYPVAEGDPYYPIPRPENAARYKRYKALADQTPGVHFVGRLATYRYYNMDQVVAQALTVYAKLAGKRRSEVIQVRQQSAVTV